MGGWQVADREVGVGMVLVVVGGGGGLLSSQRQLKHQSSTEVVGGACSGTAGQHSAKCQVSCIVSLFVNLGYAWARSGGSLPGHGSLPYSVPRAPMHGPHVTRVTVFERVADVCVCVRNVRLAGREALEVHPGGAPARARGRRFFN